MTQQRVALNYHATSFSQGRMDFTWDELTDEERANAYADWAAGKGLMGGDPRRRPGSDLLPPWALKSRFFRTLAMDDERNLFNESLKKKLTSDGILEIEIGFGRGDFLLNRAQQHPDTLFLGYEVKTKAARLFLQRCEKLALTNVWTSDDDARFNVPRIVPNSRVDTIHVLFPDPWWKDQHRVKRLFSPPFVDLLATKLRSGGMLHFKSDVEDYGKLVQYLVEQHPSFGQHDPTLAERIGDYAPTHREFWCQKQGKPVFAWYFERNKATCSDQ